MTVNDSSQYALALQAEAGDVSAQYRLGVLFLLGSGMEQDTEAACRWLLAAATGHHRGAQALVERLAPFYRDTTDDREAATKPRVLRHTLGAFTRMSTVIFDRCEETAKQSMLVFRGYLAAKRARSVAGDAQPNLQHASSKQTD